MYKDYKIIALCITKAFEERGNNFIAEVNAAVVSKGYRLFVYHSCSDFYWGTPNEECDKTVFDLMDYSIIDAIIMFDEKCYDRNIPDKICKKAAEHDIPVILIGAERENCVNIVFGYENGFEQVVRHVIEHHKANDIFFIAGNKGNDFSEKRIDIYKKVLAENNMPFDENRLGYGDFWWGPTEEIMQRLYTDDALPKAFICENDSMAITVCAFLQKRGIGVPEDIIVTGFDGLTEARYCIPPITTCGLSFKEMARTIADVIERKFAGKPVKNTYTVDFTLDVYSSCGCVNPHPPINTGDLLKSAGDRFAYYQGSEQLFYSMSENIMISSEPSDIIKYFSQSRLFNLAVFVNKNSFDRSLNPASDENFKGFDEEMILLYCDGKEQSALPCPFERKEILPGFESVMESGNPLLFNTLGFLGIPYGYVCFYFYPDYDTYCRIQQYVSAMNYSVGGYRNVNYVRYIAKNIEYIADHDYMTGLYNRSGFYKQIDGAVLKGAENEYMSVTLIDMDGLKVINDTYGHDSGDFAIKSISDAVENISLKNKICGRFGGDEFVVCAVAGSPEEAEGLIRNDVNIYLENVNSKSGKPFKVSASIGTAAAPVKEADFDNLFKLADDNMYKEKITKPNHRKRN